MMSSLEADPSESGRAEPGLLKQRVEERLSALGKRPIPTAVAAGLGRDFITDILSGKKQSVRGNKLIQLAEALECPPLYLLDPQASLPEDDADRPRARGYPLLGKVGAGGEGRYEDDYAKGAAADWIDPLPGMPLEADIIALETDGDSMAPLVFDGDLAFFGPIRHDVENLVNQRVMARLADGKKFFKVLKRGESPGRYTLRSLNPATPDIENVEVTWVLPYRGSRPR